MNIMSIPRFTAEASLYKTSGHYRMAGAPNDLVGSREVLPQLPIGFCQANCDLIQDDFLRDVCNLRCFNQPGGEVVVVVVVVVVNFVVRDAGRVILTQARPRVDLDRASTAIAM